MFFTCMFSTESITRRIAKALAQVHPSRQLAERRGGICIWGGTFGKLMPGEA